MKKILGIFSLSLVCGSFAVALFLNGGCGSKSGGTSNLMTIPVAIGGRTGTTGLDLAPTGTNTVTATSWTIDISGCVSGWNTSCSSNSFQVYNGDTKCLGILQTFKISGKTYNAGPSCSSITWQAGSSCSFVNAANTSDSLNVVVLSQLSSPTKNTDSVSFQFGAVGTGTAQLFTSSQLGFGVQNSVVEQLDPNFQISSLFYYGINANGSGNFAFNLLCANAQVNGNCDTVPTSKLDYALVAYPSQTITANLLESLMNSAATLNTISTSTDLITTGNGGFVTKIMAGPGQISTTSDMLLILRETGTASGQIIKSYRSFRVQLQALPSCNC